MSDLPFNIDSVTNKSLQSDMNTSFNSIDNLIANWEPETTLQDYEIFFYIGTLETGFEQQLPYEPLSKQDVFGQIGSFNIKVGSISTAGVFSAIIDDSLKEAVVFIYQPYRVKRNPIL